MVALLVVRVMSWCWGGRKTLNVGAASLVLRVLSWWAVGELAATAWELPWGQSLSEA